MRRKLVSFIISVVVLLSAFPFSSLTASAICCRKDFFDKSRYTLTGNMAEDVATIAKSQKGRTEAEFGYSGVDAGAWCDEFVADCIENAGADSSIVGHGGTVANFESVMREKGAIEVSSPQTGDLCFMTWSHVEIVTKVENGVVYCAGGNNAGGKCAGERSFSNSQIRLFLRPNYNNIPVPDLVTPTISTDKDSYTVGDTVNISWTASPAGSNLSHYWLVISGPNGEYPYAGTMNLNTSYSFVASQAGDYTITTYATPKGSLEGEGSLTDTKTISVQEKEIAWNMSLSTSSMNFILGQGQKSTTTLTVNGDMSKGGIVNTDDSGCKDIVDITYNNDGKKTSTQAIMSFTVTPKAVGSGNCLFYVTVNGTTVASVNLSISVTIDSCKVRLYDDGVIMAEYGIKCGTVFDDFLLPDMSKTGYTFEGWYTAESGGTKYSVGSKVPKISELNLYAHWSKYKFNVTRNTVTLNITDNSSEEIVFSFENIRSDDHPLVNIHTIRGEDRKISYTWGTWDNNSIKLTAKGVATGTETITFNLIDNDTKEVLATQKVTFIVEQNKCSVTWNSNFTGGTVKHTEYVWGDTFGAAADTPPENRTGYTFEGWYNGSIKITPDTLVPEKDALTLYASWKADGIYVS
ncbi:MAG: InlB B-repeat-containing protein, partial [Ruminococcus sp.]